MSHFDKATRIQLFDIHTASMRAFHLSWVAFFLSFFAWFGIAPLMPIVRDELALTTAEVGNTIVASVAATIVARPLIGWVCDRYGPRRTYSGLLILGALPVMGIGLAHSYETFLLFRLAIGTLGASFVVTQYHTSVFFAPNIVGTANATTAGWGNLGGGVTQFAMPLLFTLLVGWGCTEYVGWRLSMGIVGALCMGMGVVYYFFAPDPPEPPSEANDPAHSSSDADSLSFLIAAKDYRVWVLFLVYAACFGMELTFNNIAALYFADVFELNLTMAGSVAALFGVMNIFARPLGGFLGDWFDLKRGLNGRVQWLFIVLLVEGLVLLLFSQVTVLPLAIAVLIAFSIFTQMAEGATFSVVPFVNKKALGAVMGIVGAGGNTGALLFGFLFKGQLSWSSALFILALVVTGTALLVPLLRFSDAEERRAREARAAQQTAPAQRAAPSGAVAASSS